MRLDVLRWRTWGGLWLGLLLAFPRTSLEAQSAIRWTVTLRQGNSDLRGELQLDSLATGSAGRLLLQNQDTTWRPLEGLTRSATGEIAFHVAGAPPLSFDGRVTEGAMEGRARMGGTGYRWRATRLAPGQEYYAAAPRFVLREVVIGLNDSAYRVPGAWVAAARRAGEGDDSTYQRYADLARTAGFQPIARDSLGSDVLRRAMGLYQRAELRARMIAALTTVRDGLRDDTTRARFDYLFQPASGWRVDIHDAALAQAARQSPGISWAAALPAMKGAGFLPAGAAPADVPGALYGVLAHWSADSLAAVEDRARLLQSDSASGIAVLSLIQGYSSAEQWYREVMEFFLRSDWLPGPDGPTSITDLMQRVEWADPGARAPELAVHVFGYPEGSARFGMPDSSALRLVVPENVPAFQWLERHGVPALLASVHALGSDFGSAASLDTRDGSWRVLSPRRYADESFNGFLEPRDEILLDPSYEPLFAVGSLVHEWLHIEHERRWRAGPGRPVARDSILLLPELDPFLAEGLAEWETERLLQPAARRLPLLLLGEAEKRASLPRENPHVLGYHMVRVLARSLGRPRAVLTRLVELGGEPAAVAALPAVARRLPATASGDLLLPKLERHVLIPEIEFTIEDGAVRVAATRILPP